MISLCRQRTLVLMVDTYNQRLVNMDRRVMIEERGHQYEGTARGIDAEGGLLVERMMERQHR